MALKDTIRWARDEWGIFRKGGEMGWGERARWVRQWVPFGLRTIGWGTLSITVGPFTKGAASTWAARKWSKSSADGLRIPIALKASAELPPGGFMYASNHQSLVDILVLGATLPGDFKWAAKRSVMNVPFLGWHLRLAGHVPVDRQKGQEAVAAVIEAFEGVLLDGKPLLVFPEGTRSADGKLKAFKNGGFQAAVGVGKPVVPVAIEGTFALMSREAVDTGKVGPERSGRTVTVQIGEPLYPNPELDEAEAVTDLRDRTRAAIVAMLGEVAAPEVVVAPARAS